MCLRSAGAAKGWTHCSSEESRNARAELLCCRRGMASDEELFAAWQGGSEPAGQQLCDRYYTRVLRFFELKQQWQAEDLTQRTFLACLERSAEQIQTFRTYLFGVARRQLMRALRDSYRVEKHKKFGEPAEVEHQTRISGLIARQQEQQLLLRALTDLDTDNQVLLSLFYWEEMNARELGELFEVSHSAMRTRLSKARANLRDTLQKMSAPSGVRQSVLADVEGWARSVRAESGSMPR